MSPDPQEIPDDVCGCGDGLSEADLEAGYGDCANCRAIEELFAPLRRSPSPVVDQ